MSVRDTVCTSYQARLVGILRRLVGRPVAMEYAYQHKNKVSANTFWVKLGMPDLWEHRDTTPLQGLTMSLIRILVCRVDDPWGGYRRHPSWSFVAFN